MTLLFQSTTERAAVWRRAFASARPNLAFHTSLDTVSPEAVRYLVTWTCTRETLEALPNLSVVFSIGAGVDHIDASLLPPGVKLVRMVEPGLTRAVANYVAMATLMLDRDMIGYGHQQRQGAWEAHPVRAPEHTRVGIMGLGQLGCSAAHALLGLGFAVSAWCRTPRDFVGVAIYCGRDGLTRFLGDVDILVCLLPLTAQTEGILNAELFDQLPKGARLVQAGRGKQLVTRDLLHALDSGHLAGAVLDVTDPEPLGADHPLWRHPNIVITPHVAGETQAESSAAATLANIARHESGLAMVGEVSFRTSY